MLGHPMRLAGKIILSIVAFVSIMLALSAYAVNQKIGTADRAQATVQHALQNDAISLAVGTALVDEYYKDAGEESTSKITVKRAILNRAVAKAVQKASIPFSAEVGVAYNAFLTNTTTEIHLGEALAIVKKAMHEADKNISIDLSSANPDSYTIQADTSADHLKKLDLIKSVKKIINSWWIFLLISLGLFVGISFIDKRKSVGAWRWPGFITFISGGLLLMGVSIWPKLASEQVPTDKQDAFNSFSSALDSGLTAVGVVAIIVGAGLIVFSFVFKGKN